MSSTDSAILRLHRLSKSFGGTAALSAVDLDIARGEVLGIVGENGAGKSTLLNIASGIVVADSGSMELHGRPFGPGGYGEAVRAGVSRVFQEQALIPNVPIYENMLLGHDAHFVTGLQWLRTGDMIDIAQNILHQAGVAIDVRRTTSDFSFSTRQLVEIARAALVPRELLGIECPVVLLDEPTASLEKSDESIFFSLLERIRATSALVFISHRLGEVLSTCDRIAVLKDGRLMAVVTPAEADERRLHALMVGRDRIADYYHEARQRDVAGMPAVLALRGLSRTSHYADISLEIRAGEVLGIGGLLASGTSPLGKGAAGVIPADRGEVAVADARLERPSIAALIRHGLGYVPAERLAEGMIASLPISWNVTLAGGEDTFSSHLGIWDTAKEEAITAAAIRDFAIKASGPDALCTYLSGGNQQKVVLARWLCRDLKVLILDNPTRGVDAGAKEEIYRIIRGLTDKGVAILLISDELLELIGLSNRIAIMQHGRISAIVEAHPDAKPSEQQLIELMLTVDPDKRLAA